MLFPNRVTVLTNRIADFTEEEATHNCELAGLESIRVRLRFHYLFAIYPILKSAFHVLILAGDIVIMGLL